MHRNTSLMSIALMAGLTVPAWGAASTSPLVGAGLSHGDVAILGLLLALSALAVALAFADIRKGLRRESFTGPPPGPRLRIAAAIAALISAAACAVGLHSGLGARIAHAWLGPSKPSDGAPLLLAAAALALCSAAVSVGWGAFRRFSPALNSPNKSAEEKADRARYGFLIGLFGAPSVILLHAITTSVPGRSNLLAASASALAAAAIGLAAIMADLRLARWDETPDPALLARVRSLNPDVNRDIRKAVITHGSGDQTASEFTMGRHWIAISQHAADTFTEAEEDYALSFLMALPGPRAFAPGCLALLAAFTPVTATGILLHGRLDHHYAIFMEASAASIALLVAAIPIWAWTIRRGYEAAAIRALAATGDPDAAESAIRKMAGGRVQEAGFSKDRAEACIARLREAASQRGLIFARKRPIGR
ncbi:MAG TPA: hypothetical protein VGM37_05340 [Armatimonadota bacterium]|jgi:hypothetical protein